MGSPQILQLVLCFSSLLHFTFGYSVWPQGFVCVDMRPQHGVPAQTTTPPYTVTVNKVENTFKENEKITVTISGELPFTGFMLQARSTDLSSHVGDFQPDRSANSQLKLLTCGEGKAVVQSRRLNTNTITVTWRAPARSVGNVEMTATVVRTEATFWMDVKATALTQIPTVPPPSPTGGAGSGPGQTTCAVPNEAFTLAPLSTDGYLVKWTYIPCSTPPEVEFDVTAKLTDTSFANSWVAIGFSKDELMGEDSVVECTQLNNNLVAIRYSYNPPGPAKSNVVLPSSVGLTAISASVSGGSFNCKFRRAVSVPGNKYVFDLSAQTYRLLVARGTSDGTGFKSAHNLQGGKRPVISTKFIDFLKSDSLKTIY